MVGDRHEIHGVPVDVVELTGAPGDVVITHLHVFHSASPNTTWSPRQMLAATVLIVRPAHVGRRDRTGAAGSSEPVI